MKCGSMQRGCKVLETLSAPKYVGAETQFTVLFLQHLGVFD
jgi:hypothetical protein